MQSQIASSHTMNSNNLNFNVLSNGQPAIQTVGYGLPQVGLQQNVQYVYGPGFQFQNSVHQGMDFCLPNQQFVTPPGQAYTCINQNGMTYLAITPNIQQPSPQCYQAIETPQGLQLFQVINNPMNFGPLCVQNIPEAQGFLPQFAPYQQEAVDLRSHTPATQNGNLPPPAVQEYYQDNCAQEMETTVEENLNQEGEFEETDDEETYEEPNEEPNNVEGCQESEMNQNLQASEDPLSDPLSALTSLTSSISTSAVNVSNSNMFDVYKNMHNSFSPHIPVPPLGTQLGAQQVLGLPDQQFPPNTRAFQVLVPTPQGMAIQTVVASYPESFSPIISDPPVPRNNNFMNLDTGLNPNLLTQPLPLPESPINYSLFKANESNKGNTATLPVNGLINDGIITSAATTIQVKSSPCHSTTVNNHPTCSGSGPSAASPLPKAPPSIQQPMPSPHCLPDSTEDLCQPTIKQSTSNIVDGIDLEDIREFARTFKVRRLVLGLTQTQVGQALCATEGPAYSQSAICRFEKLDITPRSALKIRPVLENWLREAEEKHQQGNLQQIAGMDFINISAIGKIRKRRTFFSPEALVVLNSRFEQSSHPSGREINSIAQEIGYERDVVRVWFCNKRQSLKHCQSFQRSRINLKSSDSTEEDRNSASPTQL